MSKPDSILFELCRRACGAGELSRATDLALLRRILARAAAASEALADVRSNDAPATVGAVLVSVGACLARERRATDALEYLDRAQGFADVLDATQRYHAHFARGDALGQLGRTAEMDAALSAARDVATYELEDGDAAERAWHLTLLHSCAGERWGYIARVTDAALAFAERTGDAWLEQRTASLLGREDRVSGFDSSAELLCSSG